MYYVYILKNKATGRLYAGYTEDLARRVKEHRRHFPNDAVWYYEAYTYEDDARSRERKLKQKGSAWRGLKRRINA